MPALFLFDVLRTDFINMQTLADIRTEILRLKWHVAAAGFQLALRRHALALKAGFNPEQPRDELGQWVDTGRGDAEDEGAGAAEGDGLTDLSDVRRRPPIETPPDIPAVRPDTIQEANRIAREVSRNPNLATYYILNAAEFIAHWLGENTGKFAQIRIREDRWRSCRMPRRVRIEEVMIATIS